MKRFKQFLLFVFLAAPSLLAAQNQNIQVLLSTNTGIGSLRNAISGANPLDTIRFGFLTNGNPITLQTPLVIDKPLVIIGNGKSETIISGDQTVGVFRIVNSDSVTIENLTILDGAASGFSGGFDVENSIFIARSVTIQNCGTSVNGALAGGGGLRSINSEITLQANTDFISNSSTSNGGAILIDTSSTLNATDCNFSNNTSLNRGGAIAFFTIGNSNNTLSNCSFAGNQCSGANSSGGAIATTNTLSIDACSFAGNTVVGGNKNGGGAIYNEQGNLIITGLSSFFQNATTDPLSAGGAIYAKDRIQISQAYFEENTALSSGGAIALEPFEVDTFFITNTEFVNNSASISGGAVQSNAPAVHAVFNSSFRNNSALLGGAVYGNMDSQVWSNNLFEANHAGLNGGAYYGMNNTTNSVIGNTFTGNYTDSINRTGGAIFQNTGEIYLNRSAFRNNQSDSVGGAVVLEQIDLAIIGESGFTNNSTSSDGNGGAIFINGGAMVELNLSQLDSNNANQGGAIYGRNAKLTTSKTTFIGNGSGLFTNNGGAVFLDNSALTSTENTNFLGNTAERGGALYSDSLSVFNITSTTFEANSASQQGGAIYENQMNGDSLYIETSLFNSNFGSNQFSVGGAVYAEGNNSLFISESTLKKNYADSIAGAVFANNNQLMVSNSSLDTNTTRQGGAVFALSTETKLNGSSFSGNEADQGGALFVHSFEDLSLTESLFNGNQADMGGALYADQSGSETIRIANCNFTGNTATVGGGIWTNATPIEIKNTTASKNAATIKGGFAVAQNTSLSISQSTLDSNLTNAANSTGGALFVENTFLTLKNQSQLLGNFAQGSKAKGGAIYNANSAVSIDSTLLQGNTSATAGGAIFHQELNAEPLVITNSEFRANGSERGGAIFVDSLSSMNISKTKLESNWASNTGGAVSNYFGTITSTSNTYETNRTFSSANPIGGGGAIFSEEGVLTLTRDAFIGNFCEGNNGEGGAVFSLKNSISIENSTFAKNQSESRAGAIKNIGNISIDHCTIMENYAPDGGGFAQDFVEDKCLIQNSILAENLSDNSGTADYHLAVGNIESLGYNFVGAVTGNSFLSSGGDTVGSPSNPISPLLDTLSNGYYSPRCDSPILEKANPNSIGQDQLANAVFKDRRDIGSIEFQDSCIVISTTELEVVSNTELSIYPNPISGEELFFSNFVENDYTEIAVLDQTGRTIRKISNFSNLPKSISVKGLRKGVYYFQAQGKTKTTVLPFIKM